MSRFARFFYLVGVFVFAARTCLMAQDAAPPAVAPPTDAAPPAATAAPENAAGQANAGGQAKAAFDKKFEEYKAALREIQKLNVAYQAADAQERTKINEQLTGQVAHAQSLVNAMVEAALEAYRFAPKADQRITDLLVEVARYDAVGRQTGPGQAATRNPDDVFYQIDGGDRYEQALPIINTLIEGGADNKELPVWGFICASVTNNYDLAKKYFEMAEKSGVFMTLAEKAAKPDVQEPQAGATKNVMHLADSCAANMDTYRELWAKESAIRDAEAKADDLPRVKFTTNKGEITIELFENEAPQSVANFLTLVKQGFYNGSPFHRVLPQFMAQGGAKDEDGQGGPGYTIRCECYRPDYRRHFRGTLSMAHAGRDTGNSQFFLTFVPTPHLNGKHTAFGRVIEGMDVLAELQRRSTMHQQNPPKADRIIKAEVIRDRGHEYTFEKLPDR